MTHAITLGKSVELEIKEMSAHARDNPWIKSFKLRGVVVENPTWLGPDYVTIHTGNPRIPNSFVPIHRIISARETNGADLTVQSPVKSMTNTWTVTGSKGDKHTVTQQGNKFTCTCKGFEFRRNCKHIIEIQNGSTEHTR
jgi:hypothetical protein